MSSRAVTTNGLTGCLHKEGGKQPADWLMNGQGRADTPEGVALHPDIRHTLQPWAERYGVATPIPL